MQKYFVHHREGGLNLERLLVASRRLGSRKFSKFFSHFGWEKNKLVSKCQTQAVELKNAIKKYHPKCVSLSGRGGALGKVRHVSLLARFFFHDGPLVVKQKLFRMSTTGCQKVSQTGRKI